MGETTAIEWTDKTWNPWTGCHKVSAGCKHCYMFREQARYGHYDPDIVRRSKTTFNAPFKWHDPALVFTCSWSDFFIQEADGWRDEAWSVIRQTPHLTYQILTKRPERIAQCLPADWGDGYANVWLGVTVEHESVAYERLLALRRIPAVLRFISAEPLLSPLYLTDYTPVKHVFHWLIVGGESGPNCRPMPKCWVESLISSAQHFNIPVFFKQWGGYPDKRDGDEAVLDGKTYKEFPAGVPVAPRDDKQLSLF